jgi:pimeloyl-ACP methyl ester carboxylesterase
MKMPGSKTIKMSSNALLLAAILFNVKAHSQSKSIVAKEIFFELKNGKKVFADQYFQSKKGKTKRAVLLLHQGGSNGRGEYSPIIPKLLDANFNVLTVDLSCGGNTYGGTNRTVNANKKDSCNYCNTYEDAFAAFEYLFRKTKGKIFIWGSSYSGLIALKLAKERPKDVEGVIAFSPALGEPVNSCRAELQFPNKEVSILVLREKKSMENENVKKEHNIYVNNGVQIFLVEKGAHGASMLVEERVNASTAEQWKAVLDFMKIR